MIFAVMLALGQTTTDCVRTTDITTTCTTQSPSPAPSPDLAKLVASGGPNPYADMTRDAQAAANERRATAYDRVAELIAKGDCDGARRLADFYGHRDIIKDTARACPKK